MAGSPPAGPRDICWVIAAAAPYFLCMASDLRDSGHRASDVFRIYGFNLVLLAVNTAGTLKSLQQAMTNAKIPFARTPKVKDRTAAPGIYVLIPFLIVAFSIVTLLRDIQAENWGNAAFAALNALLCSWAIVAYIGVRNSIVDMALGVVGWLYVPEKPARPASSSSDGAGSGTPAPVSWRGILHHGDRRLGRDVARAGDLRRRVSPH